jgi:dephospho-CoA kinase
VAAHYLIGLTGAIGTGKSTVLRLLEELGAKVIDADALAHQVIEPGKSAWQSVREAFGEDIVLPDGHIDRAKLAAIVFADPEALKRLEAIVHPAVIVETMERIANAEEKVIVIEAIKLVEAGMHRWCDALWVVTCRPEQQRTRLLADRSMSAEEIEQRLAAQSSWDKKLRLADVIIENSGSVEETRQQVKREWERIMAGFDAASR